MNLKEIKSLIAQFKAHLAKGEQTEHLFKWEAQQNFQDNWDVEALDFGTMYSASLHCSETKRLWLGDNYFPKDMMLKFIKLQPDFARHLFKDLFYETNNVGGRTARFVFHCDELLTGYKEANPLSIENNHFHDDGYQMIALYLAFRYPDSYTLYNGFVFRRFLKYVQAKPMDTDHDMERFFKVANVLYKFLEKEEGLIDLHEARLDSAVHYQGKSLLLVHEFLAFCNEVIGA